MEVLLFGPGYGECVLVGLGNGRWMIIDSCLDDQGRQPALDHLRSVGATPETDVDLVVVTHWHDDHVAGISEVVATCASARVVCSLALGGQEFLALVDVAERSGDLRSGVRELAAVLDLLAGRAHEPPEWAISERRVWARFDEPSAEVWLLSPSPEAVQRSLQDFGRLLDDQRAPVRPRIRAVRPNHASVVVAVRVDQHMALFGGDLETHPQRVLGWGAIVESTSRPQGRATLYKVAHHGSANADAPEIWEELLAPSPTACVAPFVRGKVTLPQAADVTRMCERATAVFQTAPAKPPGPRRRPPAVQRTIAEVAGTLRRLEPPTGAVHLRPTNARAAPSWQASLYGGAFEACTSSVW